MRLSLGAFLIIGLPIGLASAAEFHKVALRLTFRLLTL